MTQTTLFGGKKTRVGHWKKDACTVYIGRGRNGRHMMNTPIGEHGWLGNPFPVSKHGRVQCIENFRIEFEARIKSDKEFRAAVRGLSGETLGCHCQRLSDDGPLCHGETIAQTADRLAGEKSD